MDQVWFAAALWLLLALAVVLACWYRVFKALSQVLGSPVPQRTNSPVASNRAEPGNASLMDTSSHSTDMPCRVGPSRTRRPHPVCTEYVDHGAVRGTISSGYIADQYERLAPDRPLDDAADRALLPHLNLRLVLAVGPRRLHCVLQLLYENLRTVRDVEHWMVSIRFAGSLLPCDLAVWLGGL